MTPEENRRRLNQLRAEEGAQSDGRTRRRNRGKGARSKNQGASNGQAKLNPALVSEIRASKAPHSALAKRFGVDRSLIGKVKRGELWGHVA